MIISVKISVKIFIMINDGQTHFLYLKSDHHEVKIS